MDTAKQRPRTWRAGLSDTGDTLGDTLSDRLRGTRRSPALLAGLSMVALGLASCGSGACGGSSPRTSQTTAVAGGEARAKAQAPQPTSHETEAPAAPTTPVAARDGTAHDHATSAPSAAFARTKSYACAKLFPRRSVRVVRYGYLFVDELHAALDFVRSASSPRTEVLLWVAEADAAVLARRMQLDFVQSAFRELLASGARIAVVYESEGGPSGARFVVEQAFTQDAALVRQAVLRIGTRRMRPALPRAFDQLGFSANADAHVVMLGGCRGFGPDADSVQAFARTQDITWTSVEHWPPPPAMPREKDGELVNEDPSLAVRGPRLEDLQTLLGDVRFVAAANEASRLEAFREQLAQLTASGEATDLLVTFVPSLLSETRKATSELLARASLAFLKAHAQNRIAIALPGAGVVLPLESNATRVNAALTKLRRASTTIAKSTTSADALYEAAGTLAWNAQARRVIVSLDDASWSPFSAQKADALRAQHVQLTLIGREDSSLVRRWDPNDKALLRERCLLVEAERPWAPRQALAAHCPIDRTRALRSDRDAF